MGKVVIFSAPSGSGKSTIVNYLLSKGLGLEFSISATCRAPRGEEQNGREYFFFTPEEFKAKVENNEFLEWEEVYPGCCYGTLKSEVERIWAKGNIVVFDVDVVGGVNIKKIFGEQALSIFIEAPSIDILRKRLIGRGTDSMDKIEQRIAKAEYEMTFAPQFDTIVINDKVEDAYSDAERVIRDFISK
ncbi:MAG: guanylate kinase [Marinifilaceae bacterium]|nr:guanylate kinase [Marinifilaceae bacterium]